MRTTTDDLRSYALDHTADREAEREWQRRQTKEREREDLRAPVGSREWWRGMLSCFATGSDLGES